MDGMFSGRTQGIGKCVNLWLRIININFPNAIKAIFFGLQRKVMFVVPCIRHPSTPDEPRQAVVLLNAPLRRPTSTHLSSIYGLSLLCMSVWYFGIILKYSFV
jgi:hypothetical protein